MTHRHIGVGFTNAHVRLETKGTVTLVIGLPDTGTGAHLVLRQVVAEVLGLSLDEVQVELATTDVFETDSGVGGSRVTHTGGRAAYHAAEKLKEQIRAEAREARDTRGLVRHHRPGGRARRPDARGLALLRCQDARRRHLLHGPGGRGRRRPRRRAR